MHVKQTDPAILLIWMSFLRVYTSSQDLPSNIQEFLFTNSIFNPRLKMVAEQSLMLVVLSVLINSDKKKPTRKDFLRASR